MSGYSRRQRKKTKKEKAGNRLKDKSDTEIEELTDKSKTVIENAIAPINIFEGAVRSTKTITSIFAWLKFILLSPHNLFLLGGKSRTSLLWNVVVPMMTIMDQFGIDYDHRAGDGYLEIEGKMCRLVGCHNETASNIIKGMTLGGACLDEAETYPYSVLQTILDRLSLRDARAFLTMNSNSPYHPLKVDLIDNEALINAGKVFVSHWELYDNPFLPPEYIETMELRYPVGTLGWKRKIKGLWVLAEGAIYDRFVESKHTFHTPPFKNYDEYVLTTDEGRGNATVIGLMGIKYAVSGNHYHLLDEVYWDVSQHNGRQLTTHELINGYPEGDFKGALNMLQGKHLKAFYTPHDASVLRAELYQMKYKKKPIPVDKYKPDVLEDIKIIQDLIADGKFMISNQNCPNSITQAQSYVWDARLLKQGKRKPLKKRDHCPDMWRGGIIGSRNNGTEEEDAYVY